MDLGVLCRPDDSLHGAVRGSYHGSAPPRPPPAHRSFRNSRCGSNGRVFKRETRESLARLLREERRGRHSQENKTGKRNTTHKILLGSEPILACKI